MAGVLYDATQPLSLVEMALPMPKPTLGQRNNNYGNLRTTDAFLGKTGSSKSYDTYETPEMGMRALARVLDTYSSKHGINTIDQLINRYAPASDNTGGSHENYKKFLSQNLGIGVNDPIDVKGRRVDIMDAIIRFENKNRPLATRDQLQNAIIAADGTGDNQMAGTLSLEDDYAMGVQNGGIFVYPENYERFKAAQSGALSGSLMDESASPEPVLASPSGDTSGILENIQNAVTAKNQAASVVPNDMAGYYEDGKAAAAALPDELTTQPNNSFGLVSSANASTIASEPPPANPAALTQSQLPPMPRMSQSAVAGNRRDQSPMSLMSPSIDMNEMLIRVGAAGIGGAQRGGMQSMSDMGAMYGKIQDANRATGLEAYKASLDSKLSNNNDNAQEIGQYDQAIFDMQRAKQYLKEGGITGLFDNNIKGFFDKLSGNKRAVGRKLLEKLRVDDTLLRIAQTKGAISNKEMDLFLSPSPDLNDQESVWEQWIDDRLEAMNRVRARLSGGQTVDQSERASEAQVNQFGSSVTPAPVSPSVEAARKALTQ